jgi:dihydroorotase-like cyclic amidohydrolase
LTEPVNTYYQELLTDKFILETLGTHKGDLYTESKAAVAGGVTSFIDMPNTVPNILTVESLKEKYAIASKVLS